MARGRPQLKAAVVKSTTDSHRIDMSLDGNAASGSMELDRLIHERVRLAIVSALAVNPSLSFTELRDLIGVTDGNLSVHARKLEDAGYVVSKWEKQSIAVKEQRPARKYHEVTKAGGKALAEALERSRLLAQLEAPSKLDPAAEED